MINFFSKLNPYAFLLALGVGLLYCYITLPPKKIIIKHPTPENAGKVVYHDEDNNCFKYKAEEIQCPTDDNNVKNHPLNIK
jgi:hypothetical protein